MRLIFARVIHPCSHLLVEELRRRYVNVLWCQKVGPNPKGRFPGSFHQLITQRPVLLIANLNFSTVAYSLGFLRPNLSWSIMRKFLVKSVWQPQERPQIFFQQFHSRWILIFELLHFNEKYFVFRRIRVMVGLITVRVVNMLLKFGHWHVNSLA